jgi:hypothetical protein
MFIRDKIENVNNEKYKFTIVICIILNTLFNEIF